MRKVQSYKLKNVPVEALMLPRGASIVTAMDVNGEPTLFAMVDGDEPEVTKRIIHRIQTGYPQADTVERFSYIGSFSIANYGVVYHFYEDQGTFSTPPITPEEVAEAENVRE